MTPHKYTESDLENAVLEWLSELGYGVAFGPDIAPGGEHQERGSYHDIVLRDRFLDALLKINPGIPTEALNEASDKVLKLPWLAEGHIAQSNQQFHKMLADGVDVMFMHVDGEFRGDKVYLVDTKNLENNDWLAVNQYTIAREDQKSSGGKELEGTRRPDVVVFVNGLPLAVFELKNPADVNATNTSAFNQIQTYKAEIPTLFAYNELCIISDHVKSALVGTISSDSDRFVGWKSITGDKYSKTNDLEVLIKGMFDKARLLDIAKNFVVFENEKDSRNTVTKIVKKLAAYHQYFAVNKAVESTIRAASVPDATMVRENPTHYGLRSVEGQPKGDKRAGVVWHTQGSGKSLSMVFYAGKIIQVLDNPTLVLLTDRNDLDGQLFGTFSKCSDLVRQIPKQAQDREDLKKLLSVASGGVVFTTIQKFMPEGKGDQHPLLSDRRNIVVIADEAHRPMPDQMILAQLKRQKLKVQEEMTLI